jgi:hypothetical protein
MVLLTGRRRHLFPVQRLFLGQPESTVLDPLPTAQLPVADLACRDAVLAIDQKDPSRNELRYAVGFKYLSSHSTARLPFRLRAFRPTIVRGSRSASLLFGFQPAIRAITNVDRDQAPTLKVRIMPWWIIAERPALCCGAATTGTGSWPGLRKETRRSRGNCHPGSEGLVRDCRSTRIGVPNIMASAEHLQGVLGRSIAWAVAAMALVAAQPRQTEQESGAAPKVVTAPGAAQSAALPRSVERTCAPWDGPGLEFAAKAEDRWLVADVWRAPSDIGPGEIQLGDAKTGSVRICTSRYGSGPGSCAVAKHGTVRLSKAAAGYYAGSIETEGLKAEFAGSLPDGAGPFCG